MQKQSHRIGVAVLPDGTKMRYLEYIRSEHWQAKRQEYFGARGTECFCGAAGASLHHVSYDRLGHEELDDLEALCWRHHRLMHERVRGRSNPSIGLMYRRRALRRRGFV